MNRTPDYYATLGVSPTSEAIVIQAAYRALMRRYHPDTNSAPGAAARAQAINAAYAFLSDPTKRKQYDESRLSNDAKKAGAKNPPPPPSPPPHPKSAQTGKTDPVSSGDGSATWKVVAGFAGVLLLIAAISSNNDSNSNIMNVDETLDNYSMAAENLSAVADISLDAGSTVDAAAANADGSEFNLLESINTPTATLASLPLQPIRYGDIEEAANQFTKILFKGGIARGRAFSSSCHEKVEASPSWSGADRCAAFDFAGSYLDTIIAKQAGWPESGYFRFQRENQSDFYTAAGAPSYLTSSRLSTIRQAAESAAAESLRTELAERESRNTKVREPVASDATPTGNNAVDERGD